MPWRSVIVDDEPAARDLLEEMLAEVEEVEVVAACGDAECALDAVERLRPDLLFLDIQMPGGTGFDVLEALPDEGAPAVIFVTAYDEFAVRAFDVSAVDYLLKPFDDERLRRAVARAGERLRRRSAAPAESGGAGITELLQALRAREGHLRQLPVRVGERIVLARVEDVSWFEADGKYVHLHFADRRGPQTVRYTMQALERRLDPARFLRVSRSAIVNLDHVEHAEPWSHGEYLLAMRSGHRVISSRGYRAGLQKIMRVT